MRPSKADLLEQPRKKPWLSATILAICERRQNSQTVFRIGMVQGVGFRYFTQAAAERLRIHGFVRNLRDGVWKYLPWVRHSSTRKFRAMLERGPRFSSISGVQEETAALDPGMRANSSSIRVLERHDLAAVATAPNCHPSEARDLLFFEMREARNLHVMHRCQFFRNC